MTGKPASGVPGAMGPVEGAAFLYGVLVLIEPAPAAKQLAEPIDWFTGFSVMIGSGSPATLRVCGFARWHGEVVDDPGGDEDRVLDIS